MATARITREAYEAMLGAYRLEPGKFANAARVGHVEVRTARRAWFRGWPDTEWPAIRGLLEQERLVARASRWEEEGKAKLAAAEVEAVRLVEAAELSAAQRIEAAVQGAKAEVARVLDAGRLDAAQTILQEARMSQSARSASLALFGMVAAVFQPETIKKIGDSIKKVLEAGDLTLGDMSRIAILLDRVEEVAMKAIVLERKRVGAPEATLAVRGGGDMSLEEAEQKAAALQRAVQWARERADGLALTAAREIEGVTVVPSGSGSEPMSDSNVVTLADHG